jgi:hypothetical protein
VIQPLRKTHFWIWAALSVLLASLYVIGLAARRPTLENNPGVLWENYK